MTRRCDSARRAAPKAALLLLFLLVAAPCPGQLQLANPHTQKVTPLPALFTEAEAHNPDILAARHAARAAAEVSSQVSTLPDPEIEVEQFSVGSPRPFAGFSNSDFAFLGFKISQDLPYPGKLRLQGEMADRAAASARDSVETVRREVDEQLEEAYFKLAALEETFGILQQDAKLLDQIEKIAAARYRLGQGSQAEVLKAQLEVTRLQGEVAMHYQEVDVAEAKLKQILDRPVDSPDIATGELMESSVPYTVDELLASAHATNPQLAGLQEKVRQEGLKVELANKDFYPDFRLGYEWERTGGPFRDYYVLSFGVRLPIYRSRKQRPELGEATEHLNQSRRRYEGQVQRLYFEVREQYAEIKTSGQLLDIYTGGLIPQSEAAFQASLAAYQSNREDFETLINSLLESLKYNKEYWQTLAEHETAVVKLEQLTGLALKQGE